MGLSAHLHREGSHTLSAKTPSPVQRRREAVAKSFLSVKASPRGKTRSARVTSLSAKGLNPVVDEDDAMQCNHLILVLVHVVS
jgi:hypothetical protein